MLPGALSAGAIKGRRGPATKEYGTNITGSASSISTSMAIGTAASDRYVVVAIGTQRNSFLPPSVSSVTVAGTACTKLVDETDNSIGSPRCTMWITNSAITTGTTATVAATFSTTSNYGVGTWGLYGLSSSTPNASKTLAGNPSSKTLVCVEGGVIVAAVARGSAPGSQTWTGVTKDFDGSMNSLYAFSAGSVQDVDESSARTVSVTSGSLNALVMCAWSPP